VRQQKQMSTSLVLFAINRFGEVMRPALKNVILQLFKPGIWEPVESGVIVEQPVSLTVNGEVWLVFMCTPVHLEALAVGFLFNEGIVHTMQDIATVRVCQNGENIDVWLNHTVENPTSWRKTSGCTGGLTTQDPANGSQAAVEGTYSLQAKDINRLVTELFDSQDLYRQVGGVHTSALSNGKEVVVSAEDIGRHNTIDKLAGRCILEGILMEQPVLLSTGRISSEMLQKAARMNIPVVISRTSPSSLSIELAERWGITLIGYARRDRFSVYTHTKRIEYSLASASENGSGSIKTK
jgi:FdhD protein